ncbi:hypothetical protein PIB30_116775 [Stylosanthes scabra]|uniref:Uncharacterized protein n=1 Tax=Stylosanthes scabra TaxID=79078 RepID=A0ABU6Y0U2_9FABA|nr:hypothetical protein [Stylosanthes scabra]
MQNSNPMPTPMLSSTKLTSQGNDYYEDPTSYRSLVGGLQYATLTHPEIAFSVNRVSQFMHQPQQQHWKALKRILRYLSGKARHGILFTKSTDFHLLAFSDADWANDLDDRRSTSGYCIYLGNNPIFWSTRKQNTMSRSSTEAKYRCLADTHAELLWIQKLLKELQINSSVPPTIYYDSLGAVLLAENHVLHSRSKHFEVDLHFVQSRVAKKELFVVHIPTQSQVADILTKPLPAPSFEKFSDKLRLQSLSTLNLRGTVESIESSCKSVSVAN